MKREELDTLLEELTHEDITVDRKLEIFKAIQDDKDKSLADISDLTSKNAKLIDDYKTLERKSVDDFFNRGTNSPDAKKVFENNGEQGSTPEGYVVIEDILE